MTEIPEDEVTLDTIHQWYVIEQELKALKLKESKLRKKIFKAKFPKPKEGTNNFSLPNKYKLQGIFAYDRKVDEAVFDNFIDTMVGAKIKVDDVFPAKREFSKSNYNLLTDEQKEIAEECLIVKPASPQMKIKSPPKPKAKAGDKNE